MRERLEIPDRALVFRGRGGLSFLTLGSNQKNFRVSTALPEVPRSDLRSHRIIHSSPTIVIQVMVQATIFNYHYKGIASPRRKTV
jgi:hypothetical protein